MEFLKISRRIDVIAKLSALNSKLDDYRLIEYSYRVVQLLQSWVDANYCMKDQTTGYQLAIFGIDNDQRFHEEI